MGSCSSSVETLTAQIRDIAGDLHEEVTALPAPW